MYLKVLIRDISQLLLDIPAILVLNELQAAIDVFKYFLKRCDLQNYDLNELT